jgi:putative peptidoglycan lipid II flippase
MNLFKAMATVGGLTGLSRIAGFVRDILTASILGAGPIGDAFFVALKLPNFFRRVTAEGAFSVSFVPVYSNLLEKEGREHADAFASNAFMVMLSILAVFCLICILAMPFVIMAVAPGFNDDPMRFDLAVEFSRITFPYLLAMSLVALLGGVLNAHNRFGPFAFAPVLFNIALIAFLLMAGWFENAGYALAWGVFVAGIFQLGWLLVAAVKSGFRVQIKLPRLTLDIKKVLKLMLPGVIGAGVMHINLFADMIIASFLDSGSISYLYYADRLNQLPLGIVGIAVGTALLPMLSRAISSGEKITARHLFNRALEYCFILAVPAAVALGFFSTLIIGALFERGAFEAADTTMTAQVLLFYVMGLPAYIAVKVFSTVHWARQNTTTPVKIAVFATIFNIVLSLILIKPLGVGGIALATGLAGWLQIACHYKVIRGQEDFAFDARLKAVVFKVILASMVMVVGAFSVHYFSSQLPRLFDLMAVVASGSMIYGLCVVALGVIKPSDFKKLFKKA